MIKIKSHPPFWLPLWKLKFPNADFNKIVLVWGNTIYCKGDIPKHLFAHELIHAEQQKLSKIYGIWWLIKYILSNKFRLDEEVEAYRAQYGYIIKQVGDREEKNYLIMRLARDLSSSLYGNLISFREALKQIKTT